MTSLPTAPRYHAQLVPIWSPHCPNLYVTLPSIYSVPNLSHKISIPNTSKAIENGFKLSYTVYTSWKPFKPLSAQQMQCGGTQSDMEISSPSSNPNSQPSTHPSSMPSSPSSFNSLSVGESGCLAKVGCSRVRLPWSP